MEYIKLATTGITTNKNGFGAIPIQRISDDAAIKLLQKAYNNGITFYDTARVYSDSEKKIGMALSGVRDRIFIATKTAAQDAENFWKDLETSLSMLKTGYVDIYQFHNPPVFPKPGDGSGLYEAILEAKALGKVRHIGITNHRLPIARAAMESGLYETIQYPVSYLSSQEELDFVAHCAERKIGVLAMKALAGGFITNSAAAYAFLAQYDNVLPIWGIQFENELDEFLSYQNSPPLLDEKMETAIMRDFAELSGDFCRGCGYCLPCPVNIEIPMAARMTKLLRRASVSVLLNEESKKMMDRINDCTDCGYCSENCPYSLDVPRLLRENLEDYKTFC